MENPTKDMILMRDILYKGQYIYVWRGKYGKKDERLYTVGNMPFETLLGAKAFIDVNS